MQKGSEYKTYHESMTSNNTGTTAVESTLVLLPSILSLYILAGLQSLHLIPRASGNHKITAFFAEFILVIMPSILSLTIWADYAVYLVLSMAVLGSLFAFKGHMSESKRFFNVNTAAFDKNILRNISLYQLSPKPRSYITNFRAITNMLTVLCIFAVDFHIFPRRFAKTETFGFGVMDLGVGLYVLANALVAPETRPRSLTVPFPKTLLQSLPLVILGFGRLIMTRQVEYQEHVTEYGVHWNFFFTLAFTKVVCSVILNYVNRDITYVFVIMFLGLTFTHEISLQIGLQDWILSNAPRYDFVSANREGIASNMGYVSLYFGGIALGRLLRGCDNFSIMGNMDMSKMLFVLTCIFWFVTAACHMTFGVSRRLANMGYIFWILAFTTTVIAILLLIESAVILIKVVGTKKPDENVLHVPKILEAINKNGLLYFLLGNVLTGVFNILVHTFTLNSVTSFVVLNIYMLVNCAAVAILQAWGFIIKL